MLQIGLGVAQAVDRRYRRDDDRIGSLEQRLGRGQPHLFDVLVDGGVFFDVRVGRRHVGFWLVVVVVADEILDRIVRKELPELAVQLRGQRLVVRQHERRSLHALDDVGDREGLARPGDAQQGLVCQAVAQGRRPARDRLGLVAGGLIVGLAAEMDVERRTSEFVAARCIRLGRLQISTKIRCLQSPARNRAVPIVLAARVQRVKPSPTVP